jgi:hypothetical protein
MRFKFAFNTITSLSSLEREEREKEIALVSQQVAAGDINAILFSLAG